MTEPNQRWARERPEVIDGYLSKEVELGRVVGPLERGHFPEVHVSRFGLVPKNHQPDKWRLIVDLSHPSGESVNDGIEPELCSLQYTSVAEAVRQVMEMGAGAQMAKFDVESAYRNVPVHPAAGLNLPPLTKNVCPPATEIVPVLENVGVSPDCVTVRLPALTFMVPLLV